MASLRTWFRATEPHSFVASLVGVALGTAVAWNSTRMFGLVAFLLAAIGVVCLHAATNMSNDSIDFRRGVDDLPAHLVSPFTGGARVLPDAAVSFEAHRRVWIGFFAAAALIGIVLALLRPNGWILLVLGGIVGAFAPAPLPWVAVVGLGAVLPLARARGGLRTYYREYPAPIAGNAGTIQAGLLLGAGMTAAYVIAGTTAL